MTPPSKRETAKLKLAMALLAWAPGVYQRLVADRQPLRQHPDAPPAEQAGAGTGVQRVLVVSSVFPDPTLEAGSKALLHFVELLREAKFDVAFWSDSPERSTRERPRLSALDVEMFDRRTCGNFATWFPLRHVQTPFHAVVLDRPMTTAIHAPVVRRNSDCRQVYYGQDIHHRRLRAGQSRTHDKSASLFDMACMAHIEQRLWLNEDVILYPSAEETAIVNAYRATNGLPPNAEVMPLWSAPENQVERLPLSDRHDMLFVGSAIHAPNIDGLNWFFNDVLPLLRASGVDDTVHVVGSGMGNYVPPTSDHAVNVHGWVDESDLAELYAHVRVALAPLRYGGGVKGKVLDAMMYGVPCALTSSAAEGLDVAHAHHWFVDTPTEFASTVEALLRNDTLWHDYSKAGLDYVHRVYGRAHLIRHVTHLIQAKRAPANPA